MEKMASQVGLQAPRLITDLEHNAYRFEFHAIVKVLESLYPEASPLGLTNTPQQEPVRFETYISQKYPSTQVVSFKYDPFSDSPPILTTNIMSIAGIQGPLPTPYTQLIIHRDHKRDRSLHQFIDIFNHRLLSIFHRIRKKYWVSLAAGRPEVTMVGNCVRQLLGLGLPQLQNRFLFPDRSLLYYAGLFWTRNRSTLCLETILSSYFKTPIEVHPFYSGWQRIPPSQLTAIGISGRNNHLGSSAGLGPRFWNNSAGITLKIGPLSLPQYLDFLKPKTSFQAMNQLIHFYTNAHYTYRCTLLIRTTDIPKTRLGHSMHLGWTAWINRYGSTPPTIDEQAILSSDPLYVPSCIRSHHG